MNNNEYSDEKDLLSVQKYLISSNFHNIYK